MHLHARSVFVQYLGEAKRIEAAWLCLLKGWWGWHSVMLNAGWEVRSLGAVSGSRKALFHVFGGLCDAQWRPCRPFGGSFGVSGVGYGSIGGSLGLHVDPVGLHKKPMGVHLVLRGAF